MIAGTYLPLFVTLLFRGMPGMWKGRHRLMLCWLIVMQARKSEHQPWFFGIRFALLIATWDGYRLPIAFRLIRLKTHPEYQTENALFREMVGRFVPPAWAKRVIVEGDTAYSFQNNVKMVMQRDADDPA